jgi:hypothetical protein
MPLATILYPARVQGPPEGGQLGDHVLAVPAGLDHRDHPASWPCARRSRLSTGPAACPSILTGESFLMLPYIIPGGVCAAGQAAGERVVSDDETSTMKAALSRGGLSARLSPNKQVGRDGSIATGSHDLAGAPAGATTGRPACAQARIPPARLTASWPWRASSAAARAERWPDRHLVTTMREACWSRSARYCRGTPRGPVG